MSGSKAASKREKQEEEKGEEVTIYVRDPTQHNLGFELQRVLVDERGWAQSLRFRFVDSPKQARVRVMLITPQQLEKQFVQRYGREDLRGMSVTAMTEDWDDTPARVYFNLDRWRYGPAAAVKVRAADGTPATTPGDRLLCYRTYLINHELGHAFGLQHHSPSRDGVCSIMTQQTKNTAGGRFNPVPLAADLTALAALLRSRRG